MMSPDPPVGGREAFPRTSVRADVFSPAPVADPRSVGEQLRAVREGKGLELEALARALRIPVKTLRALEEGDFSVLPPDVYVRGFLKQYAEALGLNAVPLLRELAVERARFPSALKAAPWVQRGDRARWKIPLWMFLTRRSLVILLGGGSAAAVLFYVLLNVRTFTRAPQLAVFEPPKDLEVRESALTVRGRTDATAEVFLNGERTLVRDDGGFSETVGLGEGVNTLRIVAKSIGGREAVVIREVLRRSVAAPAGASPGDTPPASSPATTGAFSLTVRAAEEAVWVALTADDHAVFSGLLTPGAEQTVSGERISITSGKAARTRVVIHGEDRGVLGAAPGVARGVLFTRNPSTGIIERHEPEKVAP